VGNLHRLSRLLRLRGSHSLKTIELLRTLILLLGGLQFCFVFNALEVLGQQEASQYSEPKFFYGEMEVPGRKFRFFVEYDSAVTEGGYPASLISIDEGNQRFDLQSFRSDAQELSFGLGLTGAAYRGELDAESGQYSGVWRQRGGEFPLSFHPVPNLLLEEPDEIWAGDLTAGGQKLVLQFRGYRGTDDRLQYYLDSVTQKAGGFMADKPVEFGNNLELSFQAIGATFTGQRYDDPPLIKGKWIQGVGFDLQLKPVKDPIQPTAPDRPQNPLPPFDYEIREVEFPADGGAIKLRGTLTLPGGDHPRPLAILISGSGPQDRDSSIFGHKPFWVLADHFTKNGIAVLRYDERGVGQSDGDFSQATTLDFAADVRAAFEFAQQIPAIDPQQIGLIGHSEGGIIAPIVAAENRSVAWIVLLAAPGVSGEEILLSQGQLLVAAEGGSEQDQRFQRNLQLTLFDLLRQLDTRQSSDTASDDLITELVKEAVARWQETQVDGQVGLSPEQLSQALLLGIKQLQQPWFRFFLSYDPRHALGQVACPVLYLIGEKDLQVDPRVNIPEAKNSLEQAETTDFTLTEVPGINHLFQTCNTGSVSEYESIQETFSPEVMKIITEWITTRTTLP
jgi:pimeloyl-ACP methyl ester carboxylesterase